MAARQLGIYGDGKRGFDCNQVVTADLAAKFKAAGYAFAVRYLPRVIQRSQDLTLTEVVTLTNAGLGVMAVQHVSNEGWVPTELMGMQYGEVAAERASTCGLAGGTTVWLDLEGVAPGTPADIITTYCNAWWMSVHNAGFEPGLYVGWHSGMTSRQLYYDLRFTRYWSAYNLDAEQFPMIRGVCMKQSAVPFARRQAIGIAFDENVIRKDAIGGLPALTFAA